MSKVTLEGYILVSDDDIEMVMQELPNHIELTRQELGCVLFEVERDESNKNRFNVKEEFLTSEAFRYHQQRVAESKWGKVSKNVKRHYQVKGLE